VTATLDDVSDLLKGITGELRRAPGRRAPSEEQLRYGRKDNVSNNGNHVTLVDTPVSGDDRDFLVTVRADALPPGFGGSNPSSTCGVLNYSVRWTTAEGNFQLPHAGSGARGASPVVIPGIPLCDTQIHTLLITARAVQVDAWWSGYTTDSQQLAVAVTGAAGSTKVLDAADWMRAPQPTWYRTPGTGLYAPSAVNAAAIAAANPALSVPFSGRVHALAGSLVSASGSGPYWVMLLDGLAIAGANGRVPPTNGTAVPLWVSDAISIGQSFSAIDPAQNTAWNYGLYVGVSSTPNVWTPVTATLSCDVAGG
jgi:hypothetical protein